MYACYPVATEVVDAPNTVEVPRQAVEEVLEAFRAGVIPEGLEETLRAALRTSGERSR